MQSGTCRCLAMLLVVSGCEPERVELLLHIKNVTPDVVAIKVSAALDGRPSKEQAKYTQGLNAVSVKIPVYAIGQGQLSVNLLGVVADECSPYGARFDTTLSPNAGYIEADVNMTALQPKLCPLSVEKYGEGSVTSIPAGVNCGTSCTMEVAVGTKVTLTATRATPFSAVYFWEGCSALNDTCEVTVTKAQKVSVQWGPEVRPKLVKVPKGSFMMGSPTGEASRGSDEVQHSVTLTTDFWMAESEVTQRQYRNLIGGNPSGIKGEELPVETVSWLDAVAYCNALSVKEKLAPCYQINGTTVGWADGVKCTGYRLPTEAEWEYAANPVTPPRTVYAGSDTVDGVAWHSGNAGGTTHAVKTKTANGRGLYDLSGNVWEWVWDFYQGNYEALPATDPIGPSTGAYRVIRGGSWSGTASYARVAERSYDAPTFRYSTLGFRFVRSYP